MGETIVLVLLDIDGTLLNSSHRIEADTINAISNYNGANQFVLCSARKPSSTNLIAKQLNINEKIIICYNGALIMEREKKIFERPLSVQIVAYILGTAQKYNLTINVYSNDSWIVNELNSYVMNEAKIIGEMPLKINDVLEAANLIVHKILLLGNEARLNLIKNELKTINGITFCNSKEGYLEITSLYANKRKAFEYLLEYLSVNVEDSLAIGDGPNDLELLKCVGIGIAMDNAPLEVKNVAKYVTLSNDENGVAIALTKFLN